LLFSLLKEKQMLHIVQVVLSGIAEIPKLHFDEARAESAYVECAKEYWAQSYSHLPAAVVFKGMFPELSNSGSPPQGGGLPKEN
jgi:hypothetical protein